MPQEHASSILIVKPKLRFIAFIASQFPDVELPDLGFLNKDSTAYTIRKCEDDESILMEIERLFPFMFKHESSRLIGKKLSQRMSGTLLDFLCCFKFELHSGVVLEEM